MRTPSVCSGVEARFVVQRNILGAAKAASARWASAERVALAGMLLVVVPVTVALFPYAARAVLPPTLLAAIGYWLVGKTLRSDSAVVPYAMLGGAIAGYLNTSGSMHLLLWLSGQVRAVSTAGLYCLFFGFFGCLYGVGYGLVLLPPLWMARRSRRFHAAEATDRVLAGTGLWGLVTPALAAPLADRIAIRLTFDWARVEPTPFWGGAAVGCALMLVLGVERLRERRTWLARVRQGKVPGWLVVPPEQFGTGLDELPVFCPRLFGRERDARLVLAECGTGKGTYRSEGPMPRFRVP